MNNHTIYDELRVIAIKMGAESEDLAKTHNIRDIIALMGKLVDGDANSKNIAEAVVKAEGIFVVPEEESDET